MELDSKLNNLEKLLLLSFFIVPFLKGLFYKELFIPVFVFYVLLFIALVFKAKTFLIDARILIIFIIQFLFGFYSVINGINKEEAIYGYLILIFPIIVYILALNIVGANKSFAFHILHILFLSGTIISIINFIIELKFNNTGSLIRFSWVIPYANTLAVYLFSSSISGLYLLGKNQFSEFKRVLLITGLIINITGLVFTYSRTMLIIALIIYVLFLFIQKNWQLRFDYLFVFILSGVSSIIYSLFKWGSFTIIFAVCGILAYLIEINRKKILEAFKLLFVSKNKRKLLFMFLPALIIFILFCFFFLRSTDIYLRLRTVSTQDQTFLERLAYYRDGVNIIRDFPISGIGYGGWSSIMYKYQTAVYFPKYAHSSIVQTALNYGLPGIGMFLAQIFIFIFYSLKALKDRNSIYRNEIICLFTINIAILLHSIIDIDFEFQVTSLIFWFNIALICGLSGISNIIISTGKYLKGLLVSSASIIISGCLLLFSSNLYYIKGDQEYKTGNYSNAERFFSYAIRLNPYSASSYFKKGSVLWEEYIDKQDKEILISAERNIFLSKKYDRYNPEYIEKNALIQFLTKNYKESAVEYKELINIQPLKLANYEAYSRCLIKLGEMEYDMGRSDEWKLTFKKVLNIEGVLGEISRKLSSYAFKLKHKPDLTLSPELSYNVSEVYYYLHDFDKARYYSIKALKDDSYIQKIAELKSRFEKHD